MLNMGIYTTTERSLKSFNCTKHAARAEDKRKNTIGGASYPSRFILKNCIGE